MKEMALTASTKTKDTALSKGAQLAINTYIKEYGEMLKFNLDSKIKSIDMEVMLEGEKEPLSIYIERYEITETNGEYKMRVYGISTSREWINTVASTYLEGKAFDIPAEYAKLLKVVI